MFIPGWISRGYEKSVFGLPVLPGTEEGKQKGGKLKRTLIKVLGRAVPLGMAAVLLAENPAAAYAEKRYPADSLTATPSDATPSDMKFSEEISVEGIPGEVPASAEPVMMTLTSAQPDPVPAEDLYEVEWYIRYTDRETHSKVFAYEEHGYTMNGNSLYVGFSTEIIDEEGNIWTTSEVPGEREIWGPGVCIIYIEYEVTGHIPEPENPYTEAESLLSDWVQKAKEADASLLGTDVSKISTSSVVCETEAKAKLFLLSRAGAINDTEPHTFYLIAKDIYPTGTCLKEWYGSSLAYSNDIMDEVSVSDGTYTVHRFIIWKDYGGGTDAYCTHDYVTISDRDATCLVRGVTNQTCSMCGDTKLVYHAPLGHVDSNGDSICDRCGYRVFEEALGNVITTKVVLNGVEKDITWTLVDEHCQDGCLYIADTGFMASELGGYGSGNTYDHTGIFEWMSEEFANVSSVNGENLLYLHDEEVISYGQMLSQTMALTYRYAMGTGDYVTRTKDGTNLIVVHDDGSIGTVSADSDFEVRPAMLLKDPMATPSVAASWQVGDQVTRTIDGVEYKFTCIDENYSDIYGNHTGSALFLMDDVIPAGYGGEYREEFDSLGHPQQVWYPGPIATFGNTNDYKYSNIRAFLRNETVFTAADVVIGVPTSAIGTTETGRYDQTTDRGLTSYTIGYQQMTERLFILSLEEAVKYRDYLWKFDSGVDNPESVTDSTCGAYWLRTPNGTNRDYDETGLIYVVDLLEGNIHPEYIKPYGTTGDPFIDTQTTVGVRPAFTLPNS